MNNIIYLNIPDVCPFCGAPVKIIESDTGVENLICDNPQCEGKLINIIEHFASKKSLDIKGLSKAILEKLIDWGWIYKISDIFELKNHQSEWSNMPGFGVKSVSNILDAIEKSKDCELDKVIAAFGIPLIGASASKVLAEYFKTYENFRKAIKDKFNFEKIDGFGPEMNNALHKFNYEEMDFIVENYLNISKKDDNEAVNNRLEGMSIVITGSLSLFKNRNELKEKIESAGGKVVSSISSKTNYLINNDINSSSSKNKKAKELNIPIITEQEFCEKFLTS